jgi:beta-lactamase class C
LVRNYELRILLLMLLCIGCGSPVAKQDAFTEKERKKDNLKIFLNSYENIFKTNFAATGAPGAAVVIVKDSAIIYQKGFGIKELGKPDSIGVNTVFRLASLSKGFTAVLTAILVDRKVFSWEDPVIKYIPEFALKDTGQTKRIKIKHYYGFATP